MRETPFQLAAEEQKIANTEKMNVGERVHTMASPKMREKSAKLKTLKTHEERRELLNTIQPTKPDVYQNFADVKDGVAGRALDTAEFPEAPEDAFETDSEFPEAPEEAFLEESFLEKQSRKSIEKADETMEDFSETAEGIAEKLGDRWEDFKKNTDALRSGEEISIQSFVAPLKMGVGSLVDIAGEVIIGAGKVLLPQEAEDWIEKATGTAGQKIMDIKDPMTGGTLGEAISASSEMYQKLPEDVQESLEALGLVAEFVGTVTGLRGVSKVKIKLPEFKKRFVRVKNKPAVLRTAVDEGVVPVAEAEKIAAEFGIELPASATSSPLASKIEQTLGEGMFGGKIKKRADAALQKFDDALTEIEKAAPTSGELGETVAKKFTEVEKTYKKTINELYDTAEEIADKAKTKIMPRPDSPSVKFLDDLIEQKTLASEAGVPSPELEFMKKIREGFNVARDIKTQRAVLREVGNKANFSSFTPTTEEKIFRSLYGKLKGDLDGSISDLVPAVKQPLAEANLKFREFEAIKSRPFTQKIKKLSDKGDFDKIAEELTKTGVSENEIRTMYETLGDDATQQIQARFMANIVNKSRSATGEGFTPSGFSRQLKNIGDEKLAVIFNDDQVKLLQDINTLNRSLSKATSVGKGSQTAILQQLVPRVLAAGVTGGGSLLAEYVAARFFGGKIGQKLLKSLGKKSFQETKNALLRK